MADLQARVEDLWERRADVDARDPDVIATVHEAIDALDRGEVRVAEIDPDTRVVTVNLWLKAAILLLFKIAAMETIELPPFEYADKLPLKRGFAAAGVRAVPVVIEDDCFIGSRCMIVDGARVRRGAKVAAGAVLSGSIPVIDAETGDEVSRGDIPENCLVVQASRARRYPGGEFGLPCALIIKRLEDGQHDKLALETALRDHGVSLG